MPNLNLCQFMGHFGQDPEVRQTSSGSSVCSFRIACSEKWKDKNTGQIQEHTEWVSCIAFGARGDAIGQYFHKGDPIYVQGKQRTRKWQDRDGNDRWSTETIVDRFEFLKSKGDVSQPVPRQQPAEQPAQQEIIDDDIPF